MATFASTRLPNKLGKKRKKKGLREEATLPFKFLIYCLLRQLAFQEANQGSSR